MTEADMLDRLHRRYSTLSVTNGRPARRYVTADHVPQAPGGMGPIADFVAIDCWAGRDHHPVLGFEVKCSRSDWLRELAKPWKADMWMRYCTRWYVVTADSGIIRPGELPTGWGHITVRGSGLVEVVKAPKRHPGTMPHQTYVALLRQAQKAAIARAQLIVAS